MQLFEPSEHFASVLRFAIFFMGAVHGERLSLELRSKGYVLGVSLTASLNEATKNSAKLGFGVDLFEPSEMLVLLDHPVEGSEEPGVSKHFKGVSTPFQITGSRNFNGSSTMHSS